MDASTTASQLVVRNNVFHTASPIIWPMSGFAHTNNVYGMLNGQPVGYALGAGEKAASPLLVNVGAGDYRLQAGSPAIDAALPLGYTLDYQNAAVPFGPAPDIGAFEYR
jgi:hypothetical protein